MIATLSTFIPGWTSFPFSRLFILAGKNFNLKTFKWVQKLSIRIFFNWFGRLLVRKLSKDWENLNPKTFTSFGESFFTPRLHIQNRAVALSRCWRWVGDAKQQLWWGPGFDAPYSFFLFQISWITVVLCLFKGSFFNKKRGLSLFLSHLYFRTRFFAG